MIPDSALVKKKRAKLVDSGLTYVGRMLRLISLAPDIIEAILRGDLSRRSEAKTDEPDGLSLEKLRKNLPVRWGEQRKMNHPS
jgi:hypothetical protein